MIVPGYCARAGLRRTEIARLALEDLRTEGAGMVVRVLGKRAKKRIVCLDNGAMEAIADYIEQAGRSCGSHARAAGSTRALA